jgi:hypothetical protein
VAAHFAAMVIGEEWKTGRKDGTFVDVFVSIYVEYRKAESQMRLSAFCLLDRCVCLSCKDQFAFSLPKDDFPNGDLDPGKIILNVVSYVCGINLEKAQLGLHLRVSVFQNLGYVTDSFAEYHKF